MPEPADALPWMLRRANQRFRGDAVAALAAGGFDGLTLPGIWAIAAVAEHAPSPGELGQRMGVTKQAASQLVESLVSAGYVRRSGDPGDRRRTVLTLTARGAGAADAIVGAADALERRVARQLGADGMAALRRALRVIAASDAGGPPG